jgi:hypothetical protein
MGSRVCTHTVPSYCFVTYQAGELRPVRMFLGDSAPGYGRAPRCGDLLGAQEQDAWTPEAGRALSNLVRLRVPCDTYVPRPATRVPVAT